MAHTIVLLRAVNVGGRNRLTMADLRQALEDAGMRNVRTLLQSGNVVLESETNRQDIERHIEKAIGKLVEAAAITRTATEWQKVIEGNPFTSEAKSEPGKLVVMFLKEKPSRTFPHEGQEKIVAAGKQLYIFYPNGIGRSKLTGSAIERVLETQGTARNWNTIIKLNEML
jgi:uncharacterized protein (DUF1697 family)